MGILNKNRGVLLVVLTITTALLLTLQSVCYGAQPDSKSRQGGFNVTASADRKAAPIFALKPLSSAASLLKERLRNDSGDKLELSRITEPVVLLHFWATWCLPCVKELPQLEVFSKKYANKGVRLVTVALDRKRDVVSFLKEHVIDVPVYLDRYGVVMRAYGVNMLPVTVVLTNKEGEEAKIAVRYVGVKEWNSAGGRNFIEGLLSIK